MLFDMEFRDGVRDGTITLTFRSWKRRQARPEAIHRLWGDTLIRITAVDTVAVGAIGASDAKRAGFESRDQLLTYLRNGPGGDLADEVEVYRVAFEYAGDIVDTPVAVGDTDVAAAVAKLRGMDRRSKHGAWTIATLKLVETMPATLASRLAAKAGRDVAKFKADVRRLKYLGLTRSLPVGYELTELGRQVLETADQDGSWT